MNQKITFDLLRLAGLLGFCKDARNLHYGREIDTVFDTLASDVSSMLKSYQDIEHQNLRLRQELHSCRCKGSRNVQNGQNNRPGKRTRKSASSFAPNHQQPKTKRTLSKRNCGNLGGACGGCSGSTSGNSGGANGNAIVTRSNGSSGKNVSSPGSSQLLSLPSGVVAMAQAEMRRAGYELLDQLGHGGFGVVYRARSLDNPSQEVAIKFTKCSSISSWTTLPGNNVQIPFEAAALIALENVTNVVDLLGFDKSHLGNDDVFIFVMEKPAACLSFHKYLRRQTPMDESKAFFFLKQITSMVLAIHQHHWVHADLKPENMLLCAQDQLKVIDFGLAMQVVNDACMVSGAGGTPLWNVPPEQLNGPFDLVKATVWSVGVIYYYMIFARLPFSSQKKAETRPLKWHRNISKEAKIILQGLLDPDTSRRWTIRDLEQLILMQAPSSN